MNRTALRAVAFLAATLASLALAEGCVASTEPPTENDDLAELGQAVSSTPPMTRGEILGLAASIPGYSYWWGHGVWDPASKKFPGKCSGTCGKCSHSATKGGTEYGADCSGFVAQAWQVPTKGSVTVNRHPYSTYNFRYEKIHWKPIKKSEMKAGDALVYNSGGKGHIVLFESWTKAGKAVVYECAGCKTGCVHRTRSIGSKYIAIRRNGLEEQDAGAQDAGSGGTSAGGSGGTGGGTGGTSAGGSGGTGGGTGGTSAGGSGGTGGGSSLPKSTTQPCTDLVMSMGWKSKQCEKDGNNLCNGQGVKTPDCDFCCGSTCNFDSECSSGQMCAYDGFKKCCQAKGKSGKKCVDTSQCAAGEVCLPSNGLGSTWVCATPECLD